MPFLLEPTLLELESGRYSGTILQAALVEMVIRQGGGRGRRNIVKGLGTSRIWDGTGTAGPGGSHDRAIEDILGG